MTSAPVVHIPLAALLAILMAVVASAEPNDPRCAGYTCAAAPTTDFTIDPTTCTSATCPKCLVGSEWDARRTALGTGTVTRTFTPSLVFGDWLSTELAETTFRILAEEMLGFTVEPVPSYANGYDILCCDRSLVYMEKWPEDLYPDDEAARSLTQLPNGYEGGSSLYVMRHTLDAYPLATSYNAYKHLSEYKNIFPKGYSTPCIEATVNETLGCVAGNYICEENTWTNTTCAAQGRYVPPQCAADPTKCSEVFHVHPTYESGYFESLIRNTGLPFVIVYIGYERLIEKLEAMRATNQHAIFYGWIPDTLVAKFDAQPVVFNTPTAECRARVNSDPTLSGADCDYGRQALRKVAQASRLARDPDFKHLFEKFTLSDANVLQMLKQHVSGGGSKQVFNISCDYLKANYATWSSWIQNTGNSPAPSGSAAFALIAGYAALVAAILLA